MTNKKTKKLLLFAPIHDALSQTFIRAHIENLPFNVEPVYGWRWGLMDNNKHKIFPLMFWLGRFTERVRPSFDQKLLNLFLYWHIKRSKCAYVLAEFGTTAAWVVSASKMAKVPLFVIFHGYDISVRSVLEQNEEKYRQIFDYASGIVAVSTAMRETLISLGANPEKVHWTPCGADPDIFSNGNPKTASATLFAVGRFVEKKAPFLSILAFNEALKKVPHAKFRIAGDGPLYGSCKRLAQALKIQDSILFLGASTPAQVVYEMANARAFVQHSVTADDGDSEGTPVAIIEAQMTGLPVISTRHAGIPDVVIDQETGYLVE